MGSLRRTWERLDGVPSYFNKGEISNVLRVAGDALLMEAQEGKCVLCGLQIVTYDRDHVDGFAESRNDSLLNARLAHPRCNNARGDAPLTPDQQARVSFSGARLERLLTALLSEEKVETFRTGKRRNVY